MNRIRITSSLSYVTVCFASLAATNVTHAYVLTGLHDAWANSLIDKQIQKLPKSDAYRDANVVAWKKSAELVSQFLSTHSYSQAISEAENTNRLFNACDPDLPELSQCNNLVQGLVRSRSGLFREAITFLTVLLEPNQAIKNAESSSLISASLLLETGRCHAFLAEYDQAEGLYKKALELLSNLEETPLLTELRAFAHLHMAALEYERGHYTEALATLAEAWTLLEDMTSTADAQLLNLRAQWIFDAEAFGQASETCAEALSFARVFERRDFPASPEIAYLEAQVLFATACMQNDFDQTKLQNLILGMAASSSDYEDCLLAEVLVQQCRIALDSRDPLSATVAIDRAIQINERIFGGNHPRTARCRYWAACLLLWKGKYEEAKTTLQNCLQVQESILGKKHLHAAHTRMMLGEIVFSQQNSVEAEEHCRLAAAAYEATFGKRHFRTIALLIHQGKLLIGLGKREEAKAIFEQISQDLKARHLEHSPQYSEAIAYLAYVYTEMKDLVNAELTLRTISQSSDDVALLDYNVQLVCLSLWAEIYSSQSKLEQAEKTIKSELRLREAHHEEGKTRAFAINCWHLGKILKKQNKLSESELYFRRALTLFEQHWGNTSPRLRPYLVFLKDHYLSQQNTPAVQEIDTRLSRLSAEVYEPSSIYDVEVLGRYGNPINRR